VYQKNKHLSIGGDDPAFVNRLGTDSSIFSCLQMLTIVKRRSMCTRECTWRSELYHFSNMPEGTLHLPVVCLILNAGSLKMYSAMKCLRIAFIWANSFVPFCWSSCLPMDWSVVGWVIPFLKHTYTWRDSTSTCSMPHPNCQITQDALNDEMLKHCFPPSQQLCPFLLILSSNGLIRGRLSYNLIKYCFQA